MNNSVTIEVRMTVIKDRHVLKSVAVCKVYNSSHLELIVKDVGKYVNDFNAKLVIIDGIISLHRAEFAGRGTLADRQQRLNVAFKKAILDGLGEKYRYLRFNTKKVS